MKCLACKHGVLKAGYTTVTVERDGTTIVIYNVLADVCEICGEIRREEIFDRPH